MSFLVIALFMCVIFLGGVLLIAIRLEFRYGDPSASYRLFAVRDKLIGAVAFDGVSRNDAWFQSLYENVNSILVQSNLVAGPERWSLASFLGRYLVEHPEAEKKLNQVPRYDPPEQLKPVIAELNSALNHLLGNHFGIILQMSAQQRAKRRIQKEKARELRDMMNQRPTLVPQTSPV